VHLDLVRFGLRLRLGLGLRLGLRLRLRLRLALRLGLALRLKFGGKHLGLAELGLEVEFRIHHFHLFNGLH
jgi:hypothetical protein